MQRQEIKEQWLALKAAGVVCFRTHTQPWRRVNYEVADEVGLLMIIRTNGNRSLIPKSVGYWWRQHVRTRLRRRAPREVVLPSDFAHPDLDDDESPHAVLAGSWGAR